MNFKAENPTVPAADHRRPVLLRSAVGKLLAARILPRRQARARVSSPASPIRVPLVRGATSVSPFDASRRKSAAPSQRPASATAACRHASAPVAITGSAWVRRRRSACPPGRRSTAARTASPSRPRTSAPREGAHRPVGQGAPAAPPAALPGVQASARWPRPSCVRRIRSARPMKRVGSKSRRSPEVYHRAQECGPRRKDGRTVHRAAGGGAPELQPALPDCLVPNEGASARCRRRATGSSTTPLMRPSRARTLATRWRPRVARPNDYQTGKLRLEAPAATTPRATTCPRSVTSTGRRRHA